ncbi:MAG: transcriptional regulator [Bacteroidetes bacterium GWF2_38_335]|nr:MAG: transcriptional regulator [Bacteroidetes bacterium GWF2_38_335]OFY78358.1 MAG: transcriptional regulator [Bacteroidetes bacterium RIFOXYA12_FULL_38_20]HBS87445.1 transcriptional regulator [Bacteroidales bacterium]
MKKEFIILPKNLRILKTLGENIRLARLRRKLSADQVSERAGMSRITLWKIENGAPTVAIGNYLQALFILGLENDFALVANNDPLGRKLQDAQLITKKRAPKNT